MALLPRLFLLNSLQHCHRKIVETKWQYDPRLSYDPGSQSFLAVWADYRSNQSEDVYGQLFSSSGVISGSSFPISALAGGSNHQNYPAITTGSSNQFLTIWQDKRNDHDRDIYLQRVDGAGNLLDEPETTPVETDPTINVPIALDNGDYYAKPVAAYHATEDAYLLAWSSRTDGSLYTQRYVVGQPAIPIAAISATPSSGSAPLAVTLSNNSTGQYETATWNFGDGSPIISTLDATLVHTYTSDGAYTAVLTVSNVTGSDWATTTVTVGDSGPVIRDWGQQSPATSPTTLGEGGMSYDTVRQKAVLYGGNATGQPYEATTWEYDGATWSQITTSNTPTARYGVVMAYDSINQVTVLFGGSDAADTASNQTWTYDGTDWTQATPATSPPKRTYASLTADATTGTLYLFGGNDGPTHLNDLWKYDGTTWHQISPTGPTPPVRTLTALTFDPSGNRLWLFGGRDATGAELADLWGFDLSSNNWTEVTTTSPWPTARQAHSLIYDPDAQTLVLVGGSTDNDETILSDTWHYQTGWTQATPLTPLSAQAYQQMAYDSGHQALILFGNGETWHYE